MTARFIGQVLHTSGVQTSTTSSIGEMRPSAEERVKEHMYDWKGGNGTFITMVAPGNAVRLTNDAYRDGYTAALSALSPLIKAAQEASDVLASFVAEAQGTLPKELDILNRLDRVLSTFPAATQAVSGPVRVPILLPGPQPTAAERAGAEKMRALDEAVIEGMRTALTHCLGVLCEVADLNNYRNLSDEELGRAWNAAAKEAADALDALAARDAAKP